MKLSDVEHIRYAITHAHPGTCRALQKIILGEERRLNRRILLDFDGFGLDNGSGAFAGKVQLVRDGSVEEMKAVCVMLSIDSSGDGDAVAVRLINMLNEPAQLAAPLAVDEDEEIEAQAAVEEQEVHIGKLHISEPGEAVQSSIQPVCYSRTIASFEDVQSCVYSYDGSETASLESFLSEFEETADVLGLSESQKLIFGKRLLRGNARLAIQSERGITSWHILKNALKSEFGRTTTQAEVHRLLAGRKLKVNETAIQYYYSMKEIAARGNVDEASLMDYCIRGLPDDDSSCKLFLYEASTVCELKSKLEIYDKNRHMQKQTTGRAFVQTAVPGPALKVQGDFRLKNRTDTVPARRVETGNRERSSNRKCYNCLSEGHLIQFCPHPRRALGSCYRCHSTEHRIQACPMGGVSPSYGRQAPSAGITARTPAVYVPGNRQPPVANVVAIPADQPPEVNRAEPVGQSPDVNIAEHTTRVVSGAVAVPDYVINAQFKEINNHSLYTIIDTGSCISLISKNCLNDSMMINPVTNDAIRYEGVNKSQIVIFGTVDLHLKVDDKEVLVSLRVVDDNTFSYDCLLGRDFISDNNIDIRFGTDVRIKYVGPDVNEIMQIQALEIPSMSDMICVNPDLPYAVQEQVKSVIINKYIDVKNPVLPVTNLELKLVVKEPHVPYSSKLRRYSVEEKGAIESIVKELLENDIIQPSTSQYSSNVVMVKKKDGNYRMAVDFRNLNKITEKYNFPVPHIQDCVEQLRDKLYYTKLDLKDAFHNIKLHPESYKFTTFNTHMGPFEYKRIPYGIKNGTSFFMHFITCAFQELLRQHKILIYVDDIVIATQTLEEHLSILEEVLTILRKNRLELKFAKCEFLRHDITYLGYLINSGGITLSPEHVQAIQDYPTPRNLKQLQSYVGLLSYFRKFIKNFAIISKPLYDLVKSKSVFNWSLECDNAFYELLELLTSSPVLAIYSPELETELHTDASSHGFGAVLVQKQPSDNKFHPIAFFSKKTTPQESKYHSFELEALAIVYALQRFHVYLHGKLFRIVTDCQSLKCTLEKKDINPRIMRWSLILRNYDYTLEHRGSERMRHVDALSRKYETMMITETTFEQNLKILQGVDPEIIKIRERLEVNQDKFFEFNNGLVFRKTNGQSLFYVPSSMENNVIVASHHEVGHQGIHKTMEYISRIYWFPEMRSKIQQVINNCLKCLTYSTIQNRVEGKLHVESKGTLPFDTLNIDYYGPLQQSKNKKKHVFEVIDGFTKYVKLYAVSSANSDNAIKSLQSYFSAYSKPRRIISDRGTAFTSEKFKSFVKDEGIQHVLIATGTPQANGQIERINRSLTPMLSKLSQSPKSWDEQLPSIEFAINNTVNRTINDTPARLLFGREQVQPGANDLRILFSELQKHDRDLETSRRKAAENMKKASESNEKYYNLRHKQPTKYKVGDLVLIRNVDTTPGLNKKLLPKFRGPYVVNKVLEHDRYVIGETDNYQVTSVPYEGVCSPQNMKLWYSLDVNI